MSGSSPSNNSENSTKKAKIKTASGVKFSTPQGFSAIKDGIKKTNGEKPSTERKPPWLRISMKTSPAFNAVRETVNEHRLASSSEVLVDVTKLAKFPARLLVS